MKTDRKWLWIVVILAVAGFWALKGITKKTEKKDKASFAKVDGVGYWTCPMHPFIHQDKPGECPVCHMKLVQVKAQQSQEQAAEKSGGRSVVQPTEQQMELLGVQRFTVEKMDLRVLLPVSGRFLSSSAVAFQVYESDLRYIKPGLSFKGENSFYPDQELSGVIASVDSIVDPSSRTVRVTGSVRRGPGGVLSETSFRGEVEILLKDRLAVPESAVLHTGLKDLVYVFTDGNRLSPRGIRLGPKAEGFFEVISGLEHGEVISSGPNFLIDSEAKIRGSNDQTNY